MSATTNNPSWYVASVDGKQEGPITFAAVQERLRSGTLLTTQLVWREGMSDWTPAGQVPELKVTAAPTAAAQSAPPPPASSAIPSPTAAAAAPKFFRNLGRGCGAAGVVVLAGSIPLYFAGFAWFTGGLILCLMWMVGEGTAAVLHSLERLGTMISQQQPGSSSASKP